MDYLMNFETIKLLNQFNEKLADSVMGVQEGSETNETFQKMGVVPTF